MEKLQITLNLEMLRIKIHNISNKVIGTIAVLNQLQKKLSGELYEYTGKI